MKRARTDDDNDDEDCHRSDSSSHFETINAESTGRQVEKSSKKGSSTASLRIKESIFTGAIYAGRSKAKRFEERERMKDRGY